MASNSITDEQLQQIGKIVSRYTNFECVQCAEAIKRYLITQTISGQHIKLYTGASTGLDSYIYDDSVPGSAISENGRHEGIAVTIEDTEIIFDNHHPRGTPRKTWLANLQFHNKAFRGQPFQVTETTF
ncbi:MAG: hypothetical protein KME27_25545 [Lyngbya sp. HA4199-MV5]|nr:hypothetical protein [Lyngbya sp. HA4199-MV5]